MGTWNPKNRDWSPIEDAQKYAAHPELQRLQLARRIVTIFVLALLVLIILIKIF